MQSGKGLEALAALLSNQLAEVWRQRMQPCVRSTHDHGVPDQAVEFRTVGSCNPAPNHMY